MPPWWLEITSTSPRRYAELLQIINFVLEMSVLCNQPKAPKRQILLRMDSKNGNRTRGLPDQVTRMIFEMPSGAPAPADKRPGPPAVNNAEQSPGRFPEGDLHGPLGVNSAGSNPETHIISYIQLARTTCREKCRQQCPGRVPGGPGAICREHLA